MYRKLSDAVNLAKETGLLADDRIALTEKIEVARHDLMELVFALDDAPVIDEPDLAALYEAKNINLRHPKVKKAAKARKK